jgi:arylsulfatase B/arylsulfatase I/J
MCIPVDYTHASGGYLDFSDGDGCRPEYVGNYSTHVFANHTLGIIATHTNDQQLFLYLPFQSVHSPLEAPAE